ncbi:MAG: sulfatase [Polyangiaceae bacterium]|jgi:arylsulfatase A-like enzyme
MERVLLALMGAGVGALFVSMAESRRAWVDAGERPFGAWRLIFAELGVLGPVAMSVGLAVALLSLFLEPGRPSSPAEHLAAARTAPVLARSRMAALAPLAFLAVTAWLVATAQAARVLLARAAPMSAGLALAVTSLAMLLIAAGLALACLSPLRRWLASAVAWWPRAIDPVTTGVAGIILGIVVVATGVAFGDTGGQGPPPLSIFGVLKRPELDLRPVIDLLVIAACAWTAQVTLVRRRPRFAVFVLAPLGVACLSALTAHEAVSLDPAAAQILESHAPLARIALGLDRKATDRDGDGASPYFAGGDCDDHDPSVSPYAIDVPGNGVDEDCSGGDQPLPRPTASAGARPADASGIDRDLSLILITVDTLRASELGFLGYDKPTTPNLDALAATSVVFERAYSMASYTGKALAPMLIGKYPSETLRDGGHFNKYFAGNTFLAERLRDAGILTMGAASHWYFRESWGLTQGCDAFDLSALPSSGQAETDTSTTSAKLTDAAIRLLQKNAGRRRFFLWVHYFDPHAQYVRHEGAPDFSDAKHPPGWQTRALYDGEVWFTDRAIGRLLDFVSGQSWGQKTAVALTSDHGEAMGEHGMSFQHGFELWEPLMRVPLIIHVPGISAHRVPAKRSVIDLVPTLLDVLRVPRPGSGELSGRSAMADLLAPSGADFDERDVYLDMPEGPYTHMRRGLIHGAGPGLKIIHFGGKHYQLYDLATDPGELDDLSSDKARLVPMMGLLDAKRATLREIYVKSDAPALP